MITVPSSSLHVPEEDPVSCQTPQLRYFGAFSRSLVELLPALHSYHLSEHCTRDCSIASRVPSNLVQFACTFVKYIAPLPIFALFQPTITPFYRTCACIQQHLDIQLPFFSLLKSTSFTQQCTVPATKTLLKQLYVLAIDGN